MLTPSRREPTAPARTAPRDAPSTPSVASPATRTAVAPPAGDALGPALARAVRARRHPHGNDAPAPPPPAPPAPDPFEVARKAGHWAQVATFTAALSPGALRTQLATFSPEELAALRAFASSDDRLSDAIGVMLDDTQRPLLTGPQSFQNPRIQAIYADNPAQLGPRKLAALHELDRRFAQGKWSKLAWDDVGASAAERVVDPDKINQELLGVCGPAAALHADAEANALDYARLVASIYVTGAVRGKAVNAELLGAAPFKLMDPADWMALSAIQDAGNVVRDYPGHPSDYDSEGQWRIQPLTQKGAFDPEGGFMRNQQSIMERVDGCVEFEELPCSWWGVRTQTDKVSAWLQAHPKDVVVSVSNDSSMLNAGVLNGPLGTGAPAGHADHWVRLLRPVTFDGGQATFTIYTWSRRMTLTWPEERFNKWVYGYLVGACHHGTLNGPPPPRVA